MVLLCAYALIGARLSPQAVDTSTSTVNELRCEYQTDPINIDQAHPRLSWIIDSGKRSWRQGTYQVLVASSKRALDAGNADLWDSGKVKSAETNQIEYSGLPLRSRQQCFWRVRVWDTTDRESKPSKPSHWEMGLLSGRDWMGSQWIGRQGPAAANPAPFLRKDFKVTGPVRRARIYACGLGYADLSLNGRPVAKSDERDPAYTDFDKRVLYVAYDVTRLVKQGENAIGAVLGTGWFDVHDKATWNFDRAPWRGRPRLRLVLAIDYVKGGTETVVSDRSWRSTVGPILRDGIYTGEVYDARKEIPGWNTPKFDASAWSPADVMPAPKGKLCARVCPPVAIGQTITAKAIKEPKPGVFIVDFGQTFSGHVRIQLREPAGTKVTMRYSERLGADGMIERGQIEQFMAKATPPQPFQSDTYVCKGAGVESWEQRFSYSGFRYAEVTGLTKKPAISAFQGRFVHTDMESAGSFECSSELLNKIQWATRYSYLSNAQSIPTDCPQREKNGWTGDAQLAAEAGLMNFRSETFYTKWLDDLQDNQRRDGRMSVIVPTGGWGSGGRNPAWDSAYPIVANDLYLYRGDKRVLANHYAYLSRYVDSLATELRDGVLTFDSLGDWVPWQTETPSQYTSTAYLFMDARIVANAARLLGKSEDAVKYDALAERVNRGFNAHYFDEKTGTYSNGSQTACSVALYFGLVPEPRRAAVLDTLVKNVTSQGHIDTGILGAKYVIRVLTEAGRADLAYNLVSRKEQPGWGWWIGQGATTLWEDWKGESSLNHIMFGDVSNWFIQWIAGIGLDPSSPGFSHISIQPQPVADLKWARATYDSPHGKIRSSWQIDSTGFHLKLQVPANVTATVTMPFPSDVTEDGIAAADVDGVQAVRVKGGKTVLEIGSGDYSFQMSLGRR